MINENVILPPLVTVLEEAVHDQSFANLSATLSTNLLPVTEQLVHMAFASQQQQQQQQGQFGVCVGDGVFVSKGMIESIQRKLLPPLIAKHAKGLAKEHSRTEKEKGKRTTAVSTRKGGGSERNSTGTKKTKNSATTKGRVHNDSDNEESSSLLPLTVLVEAILDAYPSLEDIHTTEVDAITPLLSWDEPLTADGPVFELCRKALYTDSFQKACTKALAAEKRVLARTNSAVSARRHGATKAQSVEEAFEDPTCFAAACYQLQLYVKFLRYAEASGMLEPDALMATKTDFRKGCCAGFAARVTGYCLFKNEVEGIDFTFQTEDDLKSNNNDDDDDDDKDTDGMPRYCLPVDPDQIRFPKHYLSCRNTETGERQDPLKVMKRQLPVSIGASAARLWALCGADCVDSKMETTSDNDPNIDDILSFIEENTLTICGLPFKKIDKKSEKAFLSSRKQGLVDRLERQTDAMGAEILELTAVTLLQQVRNITCAGDNAREVATKLLKNERKMTDDAKTLLDKCAAMVDGESTDSDMLEKVKACGLCSNIAKHKVQ